MSRGASLWAINFKQILITKLSFKKIIKFINMVDKQVQVEKKPYPSFVLKGKILFVGKCLSG